MRKRKGAMNGWNTCLLYTSQWATHGWGGKNEEQTCQVSKQKRLNTGVLQKNLHCQTCFWMMPQNKMKFKLRHLQLLPFSSRNLVKLSNLFSFCSGLVLCSSNFCSDIIPLLCFFLWSFFLWNSSQGFLLLLILPLPPPALMPLCPGLVFISMVVPPTAMRFSCSTTQHEPEHILDQEVPHNKKLHQIKKTKKQKKSMEGLIGSSGPDPSAPAVPAFPAGHLEPHHYLVKKWLQA